MEEMVTVYLLGKKYSVPATLTIMDAMEYAGFKLIRSWSASYFSISRLLYSSLISSRGIFFSFSNSVT